MDQVRKYLFWIVIAAVLVIAGGVYLVVVPGIQDQAKTLGSSNEQNRNKVHELAKNPKLIMNGNYVGAAESFAKHLGAERTQINDLFKDKKLVLDEKFKKAPEDREIQFDQWLKDTRQEILDMASKGGLRLPGDFSTKLMFEGKKTEDAVDREARINRLAFLYELVRILSSTKAEGTRAGFDPDMGKTETADHVKIGVESLDLLDILADKDFTARMSAASHKAWDLAKSGALFHDDTGSKPCKSTGVELRFTAPFALIPSVLQALEGSSVYYGVICKLDTQRTAAAYPGQEDLARLSVPHKDLPESARLHPYYQESPLQVLVLMELVSYDADGAKAAFAPPAPAAASKTPPKK
ncbi:MAG: hypothetical protein HY291_09295 [Planctomycetes bacterium]|nr:hypothetical protein [Planctomycetota bacterium]